MRLSPDGVCEFRSVFRVRRLHVGQIVSLKLVDYDGPSYVLRHQRGEFGLANMGDFDDFTAALQAMNPAIQREGF